MRIHIIGIAGVMTAPLAAELKKKGNLVTGSDQDKIYPPVSTILKKAGIRINTKVDLKKTDLVIVGSSYKAFTCTKEEYAYVKKNKITHISATRYIAKFVARKESILVAGSHAKTTITSLLAWIFTSADLDPSYMFGGESKNKLLPLSINTSTWSILEADESINGLDAKAKFLYYPVKYLLLTSASWEHKDSYHNSRENFDAFKKLVERIPKNGILLFHSTADNTLALSTHAKSKVYSYGPANLSDFNIISSVEKPNSTLLKIKTPAKIYQITTKLIGQHNYENILAAFAFSCLLGINPKTVTKAISKYKGIKRRLELIAKHHQIYFYDDFAQAPSRVESAILAIRSKHPQANIKVFFEPHASFIQNKACLIDFPQAFAPVNEIVISRIPHRAEISKDQRVTAQDYRDLLKGKLQYIPLYSDIIVYYQQTLQAKDVLIHFSSGGLEGLRAFRRIINYFKNKK